MNQLPSEIFLLWSVSFLIKLSCKKLPPSLVKCVFFASMYPRQVKMSNVYLNFFCLNFRWGEKLDIKIWFCCFQFPRVQILLFVGWNSTRVCECHLSVSAIPLTALHVQRRQISGREDVSPKFKDILHKKIVVGSYRPRTVLYPGALTRLQIEVFVCFRLFR